MVLYMSEEKKQKFHGPLYSDTPWNSKKVACCRLCKTQSCQGKKNHWASGLCRSCYRRLSPNHRIYNDNWNSENSRTVETRKSSSKKGYKYKTPKEIKFSDLDVTTLLERYDFKCAYCKVELQEYDHKALNAFQVEYQISEDVNAELIPICRSCNCSKKNMAEEDKLKKWAAERGVDYPFNLIPPKKD